MRNLGVMIPAMVLLAGCGSATTSYVKSDTTLGRVVVYRNGVAYFERSATVEGDSLKLNVPADKVDDFLKSLTVTDAKTGLPAPVSYPSTGDGGALSLKVALPNSGSHEVKLSYVTEAPAWKPSYRVVLDKSGKLALQAWAIVDNTSGEDWQNVKLGVGSSSAMSFRFSLRDLRIVDRQTLRAEDLFAQAPPLGGASYGQGGARVFGEFSDNALALDDSKRDEKVRSPAPPPYAQESSRKTGHKSPAPESPSVRMGGAASISQDSTARNDGSGPPMDREQAMFSSTIRALQGNANQVVIEGFATAADKDKQAASLERANRAREHLLRNGIDPNRVVAVGKGEQSGRSGGVRVLEAPQMQTSNAPSPPKADESKDPKEPIGTSHFESGQAMTVPKGSSAMVSVFKGETEGEVVYFYDAESQRGNNTYPFRAVRFRNPTDSQLEQGPVTVFGEGRFIGEGLAEPIPAHSVAFVPFALDRQIVIEKAETDRDDIAKIIKVQRGVFSTEIKHTKKQVLTVINRSNEKATVYLRHTVPAGFKLTHSPVVAERVGSAQLFRVEVAAGGKSEVTIEEATPVFKTTDIRSTAGLDMVKAFVSSGNLDGALKEKVSELVKLHQEMANNEERIQTIRDQMAEYRARMDELHAQIFTLRAVKTGGLVMVNLERKLTDVSDKLSKSTVDLVTLQEKLMVAKIRVQDAVAELSLEKAVTVEKNDPKSDPKADPKKAQSGTGAGA